MKSIIKYMLLFALPTLFVGCEKDNEVIPDDINHSSVQTSFGTSDAVLQVNSEMSFVDLSRGVVSREWIFPEGVVTDVDGNFLTTSDNSNQKVRFVEYGEFYVDIKQVFKGDVFLDTDFTGSNTHEETIMVTVLDSVRASYTAVNSASNKALVIKDKAKNKVKAGSSVRFTVTSTGEPETNTFTVYNDAGTVATVNAEEDAATGDIFADVQLPIPGIYNVKLASSNSFGYSTMEYPDLIEVVASNDPISLNIIKRNALTPSNVISLEFSRGMVMKTPFSPSGFTLSATNGTQVIDLAVTKIDINSNVVNLELSDKIYSSDVVTLSYDSSLATLYAIDNPDILLDSFADASVMIASQDILAATGFDSGFESVSIDSWTYLWWGGQWGNYNSEMSTAQKYSGAKSFMLDMSKSAGGGHNTASAGMSGAVLANKLDKFPVVAGKNYILGAWTYVESIDAAGGTDLIFSLFEKQTYDNQMVFDESTQVGKWVYRTQMIPTGEYGGDATFFIRGNNKDFDTPFIVYLDDLTLSEAEERP